MADVLTENESGAHHREVMLRSGERGQHGEPWYRSPIVWLAAALFVASLIGCIVTIVIALGQPADGLPDAGETLFRVPLAGVDALRGLPRA